MRISPTTLYVLNLVARGIGHEERIREAMVADRPDGLALFAADIRCPGRQLDELQDAGVIAYVGGKARLTPLGRSTVFLCL